MSRRRLAAAAAILLALVLVAYLGVSYVAADRFSRDYPRAPLDRAPNVAAA